jgi:uncharacterized protein
MTRTKFVLLGVLSLILAAAPAQKSWAQAPAATQPAQPAAPKMKSWYIRLIPPRTTFITDMTAAEGALMDQHFDYWQAQSDKGICIFGGPVLDPRGPFGVLVILAPTEDEARALANADPSVKAGMNKFEVAEMKISFFRAPTRN